VHIIEEYLENYWSEMVGRALSDIGTHGPKLFIYYTMKQCENWKMVRSGQEICNIA
jgi:hypothetical protein